MLVLSERNILMEILEVMDNFDLLLKNLKSEESLIGIKLVYDQLVSFLNRHQCFAFESLNQVFDPNLHEALETVKDETKTNNTVIEEIQKGYKLDNIVIRPAKVKVIINQNKN
jgi:molecular chaperone GrpE